MRIKSEMTRDWRILLLIIVDLMALMVLLPRVTRSTTEFSVTDVNSSQIVKYVLEGEYDNVVHLFSNFENGVWVHGYSFELKVPRELEILQSELKAQLSGMIPRGLSPSVSSNGTLVRANITVMDQDSIVTFIENGLEAKVTSVQSFKNLISIRVDKKVDREELNKLLGTSARVSEFETPATLKTNLKLGIDFLGGFYYNVRPVGVVFNVKSSSANVTPLLLSEFFNSTAVLKSQGEHGSLTIEIRTPENVTVPEFMEYIVDDFFKIHSSLRKIFFSFGNETCEIVMNATNFNALRAVLNTTLSLPYDIIEGDEEIGIFVVEGKDSEATKTELEANLSRYVEVLTYESKVTPETMTDVEKMIESRSNFLGVSDLRIKRAGNEYIMVESPGRIPGGSSILEPLNFEARLWKSENETVLAFTSEDVSRVEHFHYWQDGWAVPLNIKTKAAEEMREKALEIGSISPDANDRDKHRLGMFFNGIEVYNASFSEGLAATMREQVVVSFVAITGGPRENEDARKRAEDLYINLEASFPTKLRTAGEGEIPPTLGRDFSRQVALAAGAALIGVSVIIYLRYRKPKLVLAIIGVSLSEVLIILGFAVIIGWYLDLSSVAAIIAVIGTGVDHQIIITDEAVYQGQGRKRLVIKTRISRAFFIIFTAAATTIIAMLPLAYVGLGRLRGFAIVTIVGVLSGVLITRPAYGRIVMRIVGGR